jgi:hypothetical protein
LLLNKAQEGEKGSKEAFKGRLEQKEEFNLLHYYYRPFRL